MEHHIYIRQHLHQLIHHQLIPTKNQKSHFKIKYYFVCVQRIIIYKMVHDHRELNIIKQRTEKLQIKIYFKRFIFAQQLIYRFPLALNQLI